MSDDLLASLKPFRLLGGYNAAELWPSINLVRISWLLMAFLPRWKHTSSIVFICACIHSFIYSAGILPQFLLGESSSDDPPDFSTLEGIVKLFQDPNNVFLGWMHYVAFDALIGRSILIDSVERGTPLIFHFCMVVPCLFFTLMSGPMGWLLYQVLSVTFLPSRRNNLNNNKQD